MGVASLCSKAVVILCVSQSLLFRTSHSQGEMSRDHVLGPFSHFFWANPFSDQLPPRDDILLATVRRSPGNDPGPNKPTPLDNTNNNNKNKKSSPDFRNLQSPEDVHASARDSQVAELGPSPGDDPSQMERNPAKRPLDSVGSGFMKKARAEGTDMAKRDLDRLGSGLLKRPLDRLGSGFLKKRFPASEDGEDPSEKSDPGEDSPFVNPAPSRSFQEKREAVEMIKKGLDRIGTGLLKREDHDPDIFAQIRQGLDELYTSLGNGSPAKGVDVDMVRRGLDHLGTGLLKRGLDTVGIGLLKRGIDNLDVGLSKNAPSRFLRLEGLGLLRKGLDELTAGMLKHGFGEDAVNLVTAGVEKLAAWLVSHRPSAEFWGDREPRLSEKEPDEFPKKSLDEIGARFLKRKDGVKEKRRRRGEDMDAVGEEAWEEVQKELVQKELLQKELLQKELPQKELLQKELLQKELLQKELPQKELLQKELLQKELLQKELLQKELLQKELPQKELLQKELLQKELLHKELLLQKELLQKELAKKSGKKKTKFAFRINSLDRIGTGFIKKASSFQPQHAPSRDENNLPESSSRAPQNAPQHVAPTPHQKPSDKEEARHQKMSGRSAKQEMSDPESASKMPQKLSKADQLDHDVKEARHASPLAMKKDLDEIGIGLIKKDLDYVGAGLIKKPKLLQQSKQFQSPGPSPYKGKPVWQKPAQEKTHNGKNPAPESLLENRAKFKMNGKRLEASMKA